MSYAYDQSGRRGRRLTWPQPNACWRTVGRRHRRTTRSQTEPERLHRSSLRFRWNATPRPVRHRSDVRNLLPRERVAAGACRCDRYWRMLPNGSPSRGFLSRATVELLMTSFQLRACRFEPRTRQPALFSVPSPRSSVRRLLSSVLRPRSSEPHAPSSMPVAPCPTPRGPCSTPDPVARVASGMWLERAPQAWSVLGAQHRLGRSGGAEAPGGSGCRESSDCQALAARPAPG